MKNKKKKQKKLKKRHPILRFLTTLLLLLALAVGCAAVYVSQKLNLTQNSSGQSGESAPEVEVVVPEAPKEADVLNILLLGTDERSYQFNTDARADSILLLSLNFDDGSVNLTSFERGLGVEMLGGQFPGKVDLLTHCFRWGGADLMLKEMQAYFDLDVEHYVRVNFATFTQLIDSLGGIDVTLTASEASAMNALRPRTGARDEYGQYIQYSDHKQSQFHEGENHLYGPAALNYARLRSIDSDWQRIQRQRTVLQACANRLLELDLREINAMLNDVLPLVDTNFTASELISLGLKAPKFLGAQFDQMTIPVDRDTMGGITTYTGGGAFYPDYDLNARVLHEAIYGSPEVAQSMVP